MKSSAVLGLISALAVAGASSTAFFVDDTRARRAAKISKSWSKFLSNAWRREAKKPFGSPGGRAVRPAMAREQSPALNQSVATPVAAPASA